MLYNLVAKKKRKRKYGTIENIISGKWMSARREEGDEATTHRQLDLRMNKNNKNLNKTSNFWFFLFTS